MSIEHIHFRAAWDQTNQHLRAPVSKTIQKIGRVASNILCPPLWIARLVGNKINHLANRMVLPAAHKITREKIDAANAKFNLFWCGPMTEENKLVRTYFSMQREVVTTPDGVDLNVLLIKHRDAGKDTPTVIYFNGNFQLSVDTPRWPLEQAIETNTVCNFVLFDYRGVGDSKGKFTSSNDLIVDGSSIVQWVKNRIGTPADKIFFYGFSLGGAIAALTQALDPEHLTGQIINDRSFASSDSIIKARFGQGLRGKFFSWAFTKQGYSADPSAALKKLQGQKLIIHHPKDTIIPSQAGMYTHVKHGDVLRLDPKPDFVEESTKYHHIAPLSWHEGALEKVVRFLFDVPTGKETLCAG